MLETRERETTAPARVAHQPTPAAPVRGRLRSGQPLRRLCLRRRPYVVGPYLATLGASAAAVGTVTGAGEAVAYVFRIATGRLSDRTGRHWAISITGYVITVVSVPLLALAQALRQASALVICERFGTAVRKPARDTMLAHAGRSIGFGKAFALHEALDQSGALLGPLVVAAKPPRRPL